ncbi:plexin domain-containing protein 1 isoform X1 [Gadus chalcogrammus]|uniref:plexin domain-containing protein 1 isoform X1 n=1 Tax=Gadus chalcogrammus TaxID=1042646 RepID=UPI0024C23046|nr:plexin domain-containing protein 1 isoform X1 [Gadus chalcogrammus]
MALGQSQLKQPHRKGCVLSSADRSQKKTRKCCGQVRDYFSQPEDSASIGVEQWSDDAAGEASKVQSSAQGGERKSREVHAGDLTIDTLPDNMTHLVEDSRNYYTQRSFGPDDRRAGAFWVDMDDLQHGQVRMHGLLSNTHKQAARVALSFPFPFYGHYLKQITIATGGFIFMGDVTHRMLTATQYVAPLMANFDPSSAKESTVQYLDNGEVFVVQWERVRLHGRDSEGEFTFQAALYRSGTITFSYRDIPLSIEQIISGQHPVKAGLSDAFMVVKPSSKTADARQRTIYEYHRVQIDTAKITNNCAFEFTALPSCLQHNSCELCLSANHTLGCKWCHVLQRCSDGMDRHRQEWLDYACSEKDDIRCEDYSRGETEASLRPSSKPDRATTGPILHDCKSNDVKSAIPKNTNRFASAGATAGVVAGVALLLALLVLALFLHRHPTPSHHLRQQRKNYWPSLKFHKQGLQPGYTEMEGNHDREIIVENGS